MVDCIVDTNVISDVITKDEQWYDWSIDELTSYAFLPQFQSRQLISGLNY